MPSYTARLGLAKPSDGENYDVDVVNANSDAIDQAIGARVATSTTRPATPYRGQVIFETNTLLTMIWTGAEWRTIVTVPEGLLYFAGGPAGLTGGWNKFNAWSSEPNGRAGGMGYDSGDFIVPITGIYQMTSFARFTGGASGTRRGLSYSINGTQVDDETVVTSTGAATLGFSGPVTTYKLYAGNLIALRVYQDSTGVGIDRARFNLRLVNH